MNHNLFTKEIKRNRKNLLIWSAIVVGFTMMVLSIFPFMAEMGKDMAQLMDKMPPEIGKAMGMDAETWSSIMGFYSTYYGVYIVVLVSIFTTSTGTTIISKEERDRTAEFLMTKPLSRWDIFKSKIASLLVLSLIIYVVQLVSAIVGFMLFKSGPMNWSVFWIMHLSGLVLILFFTCMGVLLSMFLQPKKNFMGIVVGLTFGTYFLNALGKSTDATSWIGYFSPFHYLDFTVNDPGYSFNFLSAIVMLALMTLMLWISYQAYSKKDIAS